MIQVDLDGPAFREQAVLSLTWGEPARRAAEEHAGGPLGSDFRAVVLGLKREGHEIEMVLSGYALSWLIESLALVRDGQPLTVNPEQMIQASISKEAVQAEDPLGR